MNALPPAASEPLVFGNQAEWAAWLAANHDKSPGVWLRYVKNTEGAFNYAQTLEVALCFGWIDGQTKSEGEKSWLKRWVPRKAKSIWSKINRAKALQYIEEGKMQPSGLAEVERARADGRWDAAYDSVSAAQVPPDLQAAFDAHPGAQAFFETLDSRNRYAVLFRIQTAKKADTRARRIADFTARLARGEKLVP